VMLAAVVFGGVATTVALDRTEAGQPVDATRASVRAEAAPAPAPAVTVPASKNVATIGQLTDGTHVAIARDGSRQIYGLLSTSDGGWKASDSIVFAPDNKPGADDVTKLSDPGHDQWFTVTVNGVELKNRVVFDDAGPSGARECRGVNHDGDPQSTSHGYNFTKGVDMSRTSIVRDASLPAEAAGPADWQLPLKSAGLAL
jgi:hypothetical protein